MEHRADLARLEKCIDTLLNQHAQLKADYLTLQRSLQERDAEVKGLKREVEQLLAEREEVGGRVIQLLGRIERWQQVAGDAPADSVHDGGNAQKETLGNDVD
ncbi:MAG: cell division protein ZapB [Desulfobulbaceae bacterium]|nr:cell division protein ZapB [Desulfobulbaceae bacterium]